MMRSICKFKASSGIFCPASVTATLQFGLRPSISELQGVIFLCGVTFLHATLQTHLTLSTGWRWPAFPILERHSALGANMLDCRPAIQDC
jgi:hypothetical protein